MQNIKKNIKIKSISEQIEKDFIKKAINTTLNFIIATSKK
jgi:hypothetical protein